MPLSGDIITRQSQYGDKVKYIWVICPKCNEGRFVTLASTKRKNYTGFCAHCFQEMCREAMTKMKEGFSKYSMQNT